jgi:hypothetical protein
MKNNKAEGFYNKTKTKFQTRKSKQLENKELSIAYNKIIDELSLNQKKRITENWNKYKNKLRDNIKSKKEKEIKAKTVKEKQIKNLPSKLRTKILLSVGNKYKEHDESIALFISNLIEFDNYKKDISIIIDIIYEIYSKFLLNVIYWMTHYNYLRGLDNPYLSGDDELPDWIDDEKYLFRTKKIPNQIELIEKYGNLLNKIIIIFKSIIESKNLLNIKNKEILDFISKLELDWKKLIKQYQDLELSIFLLTREELETERKNLKKKFKLINSKIINVAYDNVFFVNEDLLKLKLSEIKNIYNDTNLYPKKKLESLMRQNNTIR